MIIFFIFSTLITFNLKLEMNFEVCGSNGNTQELKSAYWRTHVARLKSSVTLFAMLNEQKENANVYFTGMQLAD